MTYLFDTDVQGSYKHKQNFPCIFPEYYEYYNIFHEAAPNRQFNDGRDIVLEYVIHECASEIHSQ